MNASTFTARVIASTLSDMHSAITGAIGALKGPLHGGANEQVMNLLMDIGSDENDRAGDPRAAGPQASGSWASATASTRPTTRAP